MLLEQEDLKDFTSKLIQVRSQPRMQFHQNNPHQECGKNPRIKYDKKHAMKTQEVDSNSVASSALNRQLAKKEDLLKVLEKKIALLSLENKQIKQKSKQMQDLINQLETEKSAQTNAQEKESKLIIQLHQLQDKFRQEQASNMSLRKSLLRSQQNCRKQRKEHNICLASKEKLLEQVLHYEQTLVQLQTKIKGLQADNRALNKNRNNLMDLQTVDVEIINQVGSESEQLLENPEQRYSCSQDCLHEREYLQILSQFGIEQNRPDYHSLLLTQLMGLRKLIANVVTLIDEQKEEKQNLAYAELTKLELEGRFQSSNQYYERLLTQYSDLIDAQNKQLILGGLQRLSIKSLEGTKEQSYLNDCCGLNDQLNQ